MATANPSGRAHHGDAESRPGRWEQRVPGPQLPGLVSGVTLVLGAWLVLVPFAWTYGDPEGGFDARWNDVLAGLALAGVGAARILRPVRLIPVTALSVLLGGWLIIAPFLLEYGYGADSSPATVNDVLVGATIAGLAMLEYVNANAAAHLGR